MTEQEVTERMNHAEIGGYFKKLFENEVLVAISALGAIIYKIIFPETIYLYASGAVLGIFLLDLLTRLYALSKRSGGFWAAIAGHRINSAAFAKGTLDKLLIFGVMLIICGLSYRIVPIEALAVWFTQMIFTLMFLRDVLSIIENLTEAGVEGLSIFKRVVKKKMSEYVEEDTNDKQP